jgi:hypothetical protein
MRVRVHLIVAIVLSCQGTIQAAPALVEYPSHPATYGDHTINATWTGGPTPTVLVEFQSDEAVLHEDGNGQSQRTARNTLTHNPPSSAANPQDFDNVAFMARYGARLPLLQQLAADGTSVLTYRFPAAVSAGVDLIVTDVDQSDAAKVRAFGTAGELIDMTTWRLAGAGDLSLYKNTGPDFSAVVAPTPTTAFLPEAISLTAVDGTNYNRSFSILRAPSGSPIQRIEIEFTGVNNSPSRELGGNGSHIYVALSTSLQEADFNGDGHVDATDLSIWTGAFGINQLGDANGDNKSSADDFLIWQQQFGAAPAVPVAHAVPEPATVAPWGVALLLAARCRRRSR